MTTTDLIQPRYCVCANLRAATRQVAQAYGEFMRPTGLQGTQFTTLAILNATGPITIGELADVAATDRTTLTRNLSRMEEAGWVESQPGADKRTRLVALTAAGQAKYDEALPYWEQAQQHMLDSLGPETVQTLLGVLGAAQSQVA